MPATENAAPEPEQPDAHPAQAQPAEPVRKRRRRRRLLHRPQQAGRTLAVVLLIGCLAVALLLTSWPWPRHFLSGLPAGPEAPRDAWKLSWGAHRLLKGRVLPAHDAPAFYPHAGALDFDEPLFIPSLVAVIPYAATRDAVVTYNVTLLIFWVLSGVTMYLFLRELGIGKLGCAFGAAAFVLLPYRTAHLNDITAQLCFGVPLCLMLLARWVRTQQRRWALVLALAWCLQAMSALAYALALVAALPLAAIVALLRRRPSPLDDRYMYDGVAIMVLVPLLLVSIFLGPTLEVRTNEPLASAYEERGLGAAQPLAYLNPDEGSLVDVFSFPAGGPEAGLFPGLTVVVLAGVYGFFRRQMLRHFPGRNRAAQIIVTVLALARLALWCLVGIVCLARAAAPTSAFWEALGRLVGPALVAILALTLLLALAARRHPRAFGTALMHGLGLAAAGCFVLSLGPEITAGSSAVSLSEGPLIQPEAVHPFLGTIAPLGRVGIVTIVFLIAAAAWILDEVAHHRRFRWLPVAVFVLVCAESVVLPNRFTPAGRNAESPVMARVAQHSPTAERLNRAVRLRSVFVIPAGDPETDARTLLASVPDFPIMVNGSATVTPAASRELVKTFKRGDIAAASRELTAFWPDPYLVVDRRALAERSDTFPLDKKELAEHWRLIIEDDRYALYEPLATTPTPCIIHKRLRRDVATRYCRLRFKARMTFADPSLEPHVVVRWNGKGDLSYALTSEFQPLEFDGMARWLGKPEGDLVTISLVFKVNGGAEFTPAEEALADVDVSNVWEVIEIEFWEAPRR